MLGRKRDSTGTLGCYDIETQTEDRIAKVVTRCNVVHSLDVKKNTTFV